LAVDDVVEIAGVFYPKTLIERLIHLVGPDANWVGVAVAAYLLDPALKQPKRVVPERIDLDRFASPWRDDPAVDLRVHPRELVAFGPLAEQAVRRVDADPEPRSLDVMVHDVDHDRQQMEQRRLIVHPPPVGLHRVEVPQGRIRGV